MRIIKCLFCLTFLPLALYAQENLDPRLKGIDTLITGILKEWNVPGCAVTIVEKNDVIFVRGYGYRKLDTKQPANNFLPILRFSDPLLTLQVTPRDMMTHRTGIPRHDLSWFGFEKSPRNSLVQLIQYFKRSAGYREKFQYNNYILGMVWDGI
jgi:CubicO group peptidase (beta-lactamase class C family)